MDTLDSHLDIYTKTIQFADALHCYATTHRTGVDFITPIVNLFDVIDKYYPPEGGNGDLSEDDRTLILTMACDAIRPLLRERSQYRKASLDFPIRSQIAIDVFEMVRNWADDEYADADENYPIGPDITAYDIRKDIELADFHGQLTDLEAAGYKQLKMRRLYSLIKVHLNFMNVEEACDMLEYFKELLDTLGKVNNLTYFAKYEEVIDLVKENTLRENGTKG